MVEKMEQKNAKRWKRKQIDRSAGKRRGTIDAE